MSDPGITAADRDKIQAYLESENVEDLIDGTTRNTGPASEMGSAECARARVLASEGLTSSEVGAELDRHDSTIRKHLRGGCGCDVEEPPLVYDEAQECWVTASDHVGEGSADQQLVTDGGVSSGDGGINQSSRDEFHLILGGRLINNPHRYPTAPEGVYNSPLPRWGLASPSSLLRNVAICCPGLHPVITAFCDVLVEPSDPYTSLGDDVNRQNSLLPDPRDTRKELPVQALLLNGLGIDEFVVLRRLARGGKGDIRPVAGISYPDIGSRRIRGGWFVRFSCRPRQNHLIADGGISSGGDEVEKKEQNRLETINRWDPPDADWAAEYAWTRYRGPAPWPCPGAWVLDEPEGLAFRWLWFPEVGTEYGAVASVLDDHGGNSIDTFREAEAFLIGDDVADSVREEKIEWTLSIDGDDVFSRREPDREDLMAAVAEVLTRYPDGDWRDVTPTSGSPPPEIIRERERERRREENESLDEFATDGGRTPTDDLDQQLLEGVGRAAYLRDYVFGIKPGQSEIMWDPVYPSHRAPRECPFCGSVYRRHGGWADHRDNCEAGPNPGANPVRARGEQS